MTDLAKLFDQIRRLPPARRKLVVNYAEYVVTGRSPAVALCVAAPHR